MNKKHFLAGLMLAMTMTGAFASPLAAAIDRVEMRVEGMT